MTYITNQVILTTGLVAVGVGFSLCYFYIIKDNFIDKMVDGLFGLLGITSERGPLVTKVTMNGGTIVITLQNRGKCKFRPIPVVGLDSHQKRHFPTFYLNEKSFRTSQVEESNRKQFATNLGPGECRSIFLDRAEVTSMDCQTLSILDGKGYAWPVEGFSASPLK